MLVSVIIKFSALGVLIGLNLSFALEFQLIGGVVIIQVPPALFIMPVGPSRPLPIARSQDWRH